MVIMFFGRIWIPLGLGIMLEITLIGQFTINWELENKQELDNLCCTHLPAGYLTSVTKTFMR